MQEKKILLLGAGLMVETVIDHLHKRPENRIVVASRTLSRAQQYAQNYARVTAAEVEITDSVTLCRLVAASDIVISYIPWTHHLYVAKACLQEKRHLVTASYIQPAMAELDEQVRASGLTFLNEVGVDPGIDHMATMKVVDECAKEGEKILEYESFCGGLPSPEFCDNPIGYKFSWSPVGALLSLLNDAIYLEEGQPKHVKSQDLLYNSKKKQINMALSLEGYPNRDSVKYKSLYRLHDCQKLIRGTLRFYGFTMILNSMKELNLLDKENKVPINGTWTQLLELQTKEVNSIHPVVQTYMNSVTMPKHVAELGARILTKSFQNHNLVNESSQNLMERAQIVMDAYRGLGFFNLNNRVDSSKTFLVNLVTILEQSCTLQQGETDMIVMQHTFKIQRPNREMYTKKSSMVIIGQQNKFSAMAITVGVPTAIATQLILDGVITRKGVLMPNYPDIYLPLLQQLEKLGLTCKETDDKIDTVPAAKL